MERSLPDLLVLAVLFFLWIYPLSRRLPRSRFLLSAAVYLYLSGILSVTLMPILLQLPNLLSHPYTMNLLPFNDFLHGWGDTVRQIILNIVMLLPFGILIPRLTGRKFLHTIFLCALMVAAIELLQPLFDRSCDITDFITNLIGCAIGYLFGLALDVPLKRLAVWLDEE